LLVLALDASTETMGVALGDDSGLLAGYTLRLPMKHSAYLMPLVERVMKDTGCPKPDRVAVTVGPGSFTGLRIGVSLAKGLCYAWDIPAVGVLTLEVLAHGMRFFQGTIVALMDARRGRLYGAGYQGGRRCARVTDVWAGPAEGFWEKVPSGPVLFVGGYAHAHEEEILERFGSRARVGGDQVPRAGHIAEIGQVAEAVTPFALMPQYLRRSEAEINWEHRKEQLRNGLIQERPLRRGR
jgi:tRNA threonylcarbamoyladenosine biosynthesis protein TsaB